MSNYIPQKDRETYRALLQELKEALKFTEYQNVKKAGYWDVEIQ